MAVALEVIDGYLITMWMVMFFYLMIYPVELYELMLLRNAERSEVKLCMILWVTIFIAIGRVVSLCN